MIIAIDFDGTLVERGPYDATTPLVLKRGAKMALVSLKRAGHILVLWSARTNRALLYNSEFDPLVRAGVVGDAQDDATRELHADRLRQMYHFVETQLDGLFDAIDDGRQGKIEADVYIDDRSIGFGMRGIDWPEIAGLYGE